MIHLTQHRRTLFACTALAAFLLLAAILHRGFVRSASMGGGTELLFQIQADLAEADKLESTAAQINLATEDILGSPTTVRLEPARQLNSYRLTIALAPEDALTYSEYQELTGILISSFTDITFTPLRTTSRSYTQDGGPYPAYWAVGAASAGAVLFYTLVRLRRLGSGPASAAVLITTGLNLLVLAGAYSLTGLPLDAGALLAAVTLAGISVYNSAGAFDHIARHLEGTTPEDCAQALETGVAQRLRSLAMSTLTIASALLALTTAAYLGEVDRITAFSFPLTVGVCMALCSSGVLAPLVWYQLRFPAGGSPEAGQPEK